MEESIREDLKSILPFLPLILRSSSLCWPSLAQEALKALSKGPDYSKVDSGQVLFDFIMDIRHHLGLSSQPLANSSALGYALFFDDLLSRLESRKWFGEVVPELARLLLRFPSLLEAHYAAADKDKEGSILRTGLRILDSQEPGIVFLSQELNGALLSCSLFCLFPNTNRDIKHLPTINFDRLFACLYSSGNEKQENKIKCLVQYFEQNSLHMPAGFVSFERKVLSVTDSPINISYPKADFWSKSIVSLCPFEVSNSGSIEDQQYDSLEVDFANKYFGGGALSKGCVQEEIRFMINPELIVGMLFLPSMKDNEAIEAVGTERFSSYTGYASSFRFLGNYEDKKQFDSMGRRRTRIVAIDALFSPKMRQYEIRCLRRETNKAFCGFFDQSKYQCYLKIFQGDTFYRNQQARDDSSTIGMDIEDPEKDASSICSYKRKSGLPSCSSSELTCNKDSNTELIGKYDGEHSPESVQQNNIGIATGNWGCGAFGGDPELKCMIQWLAASQALRPFIVYYTFGEEALQRLEQVTQWILLQRWTVGDLWNMLAEYSSQRLKGRTSIGFFNWLLPSLTGYESMQIDDAYTSQ